MDKLQKYRKEIAAMGLLAEVVPPEPEGPQLSEEQHAQAMKQIRLDTVEKLPLEDLLEIVARRYRADRHFRAGVRSIDSRLKSDNPGRLGKLANGYLYEVVQLQRLSVGTLAKAIEIVAKHFEMEPETVRRKYEREASRIKKSQAPGKTDK